MHDYPSGLHSNGCTLRDRAVAMLEQVGLGDRIDYYPDNLSGGQKQEDGKLVNNSVKEALKG